VGQHDRLALGLRQQSQRAVDRVAALASLDLGLGGHRSHAPILEGVEHRLAALGRPATTALVERPVAHDREDPPTGAPARLLVCVCVAPHGQERLLHDLLGDAASPAHTVGERLRGPTEAAVQQLICTHVAAADAFEQDRVGSID
jgi:hypothetical protein